MSSGGVSSPAWFLSIEADDSDLGQRRDVPMEVNRREFVILTVAGAAGCKSEGDIPDSISESTPQSVDAGPVSDFAAEGVYVSFRKRGFFVVRRGDEIFAISAVCTHRACTLNATPARSFHCKCHGSTFDANGKVTKGPARRDLPRLPVQTQDGRLIVTVSASSRSRA